jgi:hypothetical protein
MNNDSPVALTTHHEQPVTAATGWLCLFVFFVLGAIAIGLVAFGATSPSVVFLAAGVLVGICAFVMLGGFFTLQPNESVVFASSEEPERR